ncbi:NADPH-dependent curcumin reductase [compost metagenome]
MRGFIQSDFHALFPAFLADMARWLQEGKVQYREDIVEGLAQAPEAFFGLLKGRNFGKLVVSLA